MAGIRKANNRSVRGVRDKIPAGYVLGRDQGDGRVQLLKIDDLLKRGKNGATGATGSTGATGATGAAGSQGTYGGALTADYTFDTSTVNADPGTGKIRLNSATQNLATAAYVSLSDDQANSWLTVLRFYQTRIGEMRIVKKTDPTKFIAFTVTLETDGTYATLTLTAVASSTTSPFANGDDVLLCFDRDGATGATGSTGATGATGPTGPTGPTGASGAGSSLRTAVSPMSVQNSANGAFRGNRYTPDKNITITAIGFQISPSASGTYKAIICDLSGTTVGTVHSSANESFGSTTVRLVWFEFSSGVDLTAGTEYYLACGRTDSTDTATLSICVNDNAGDDGGGLPGFFGSRAVLAKAAPANGDTITNEAGNNFGWFVIWQYT